MQRGEHQAPKLDLISNDYSFNDLIGALRDCGKDGLGTQDRLDFARGIVAGTSKDGGLDSPGLPNPNRRRPGRQKRRLRRGGRARTPQFQQQGPFTGTNNAADNPIPLLLRKPQQLASFNKAVGYDALDLFDRDIPDLQETTQDGQEPAHVPQQQPSQLDPLQTLDKEIASTLNLGYRGQRFLRQVMKQDLSQLYITLDAQKSNIPTPVQVIRQERQLSNNRKPVSQLPSAGLPSSGLLQRKRLIRSKEPVQRLPEEAEMKRSLLAQTSTELDQQEDDENSQSSLQPARGDGFSTSHYQGSRPSSGLQNTFGQEAFKTALGQATYTSNKLDPFASTDSAVSRMKKKDKRYEMKRKELQNTLTQKNAKISEEFFKHKRQTAKMKAEQAAVIEQAQKFLPTQLMVKHGQRMELRDKLLKKVGVVLKETGIGLLHDALWHWLKYTQWAKGLGKDGAAKKIQAAWRGHLGWKVFKQAAKKERLRRKQERQRQKALLKHRHGAARTIQGALYWHRRRIKRKRWAAEETAANVIKQAWHRHLTMRAGWAEALQMLKEDAAALKLQRAWRGKMGRKHFQNALAYAEHVKREKGYLDPHALIIKEFERRGAVRKIAFWWRTLEWRHRWREAAVLIQKVYRNYRNDKWAPILKGVQQKVDERNAAIQIQRIVRGFLIARRLRRLKMSSDRIDSSSLSLAATNPISLNSVSHGVKSAMKAARFLARKQRTKATAKIASHSPGIMNRKAIKIQSAARGHAARTLAIRLRAIRLLVAWGRYRAWKCYKWRAAATIQRMFRRYKDHREFHNAKRIQALMRGYLTRKHHETYRVEFVGHVVTIQRIIRGYYGRQYYDAMSEYLTRMNDLRELGGKLFSTSREYEIMRQIVEKTKIEDYDVDSEAQRLFVYYCSYGARDNTTRLDVGKFVKFCKECDGLLNRSFSQQQAELLFMKVKKKGDSHLHYPDFLRILYQLAEIKCKKVKTKGPYSGDDAKLLIFMQKHVLPTKTTKKIGRELKGERLDRRADARIDWAVRTIQRLFRGMQHRRFFAAIKALNDQRKQERAELLASTAIQTRLRGWLQRLRVAELATQIYIKYVDDESGAVYWTNPRTGISSWTKPKILREMDVPTPIVMPNPERNFMVLCRPNFCGGNTACNYCVQCQEPQCQSCADRVHAKGIRSTHDVVKTFCCIQCAFQAATKMCDICKDAYCDSCFVNQHRGGRLRQHPWTPIVEMCHTCHEWAAVLWCDDCGGKAYCKVCCQEAHDPEGENSWHEPVDFPYYPFTVDDYLKKKAEAEAARKAALLHAERQRMMQERARQKAATDLQRVFRGFNYRKTHADMLEKHRLWMEARKREAPLKKKPLYQLLDKLGWAPLMDSDTPSEAVLKRYVWYKRPMVRDVVSDRWDWARNAVHQQLRHRKQHPWWRLTPKLVHWAAKRGAVGVKLQAHRIKEKKLEKDFNKKKEAYAAARSAVGYPAKQKEQLQQSQREARKKLKDYQAKMAKTVDEGKKLNSQLEYWKGPRRLKKEIKKERRFGKKIPFPSKIEDGMLELWPEKNTEKYIRVGHRLRLGNQTGFVAANKYSLLQRLIISIIGDIKASFGSADISDDDTEEERRHSHVVHLNRMWQDKTEDAMEVYRYPTLPFYEEYPKRFVNSIKMSFPGQLSLKSTIITLRMLEKRLANFSEKFDEDSTTAARLLQASKKTAELQAMLMRKRRYRFDADRGYAIRHKIGVVQKYTIKGARFTAKYAKLVISSSAREEKKEENTLNKWNNSQDKEELIVNYRVAGSKETTRLGKVMIDMGAPLTFARTLFEETFTQELNERKGKCFQFQKNSKTLKVDKEEKAKVQDLISTEFNRDAHEMQSLILLVDDITKQKEDIVNQADLEEEKEDNED